MANAGERKVGLQADLAAGARVREYLVRVITAGEGNGLLYPAGVLRAAVPMFEGATVFVDHAQLGEMWSMTGGRSVRGVLGVVSGVWFDESVQGVAGVLRVLAGDEGEWFCGLVDQYLAERAAGRAVPRVGLSAVTWVAVKSGTSEVDRVVGIESVDVVFDPARGGEFLRAMNQRRVAAQEGESVGAKAVVGVDGAVVAAVVEPAVVVAAQAVRPGGAGAPATNGVVPAAGAPAVVVPSAVLPVEVMAVGAGMPAEGAGLLVALSGNVLELRLAQSRLPEALAAVVRADFAGRVVDVGKLDGRIEALRAAWAASVAASGGGVQGVGSPLGGVGAGRVQVGLNSEDRLQAAMDRLVGLALPAALQDTPRLAGIRELYVLVTGDREFRGAFDAERVGLANVTTATMTSLVKNAFNKVILDYFNTADRWWEPIVAQETFASMKDVTLITLGGFEKLPTVEEAAAYTELSWSDAEEVVGFVKKGGYVGVTLEMMDKDETGTFRAIPRKLAIAGYRALSYAIGQLFIANSGVGAYWPAGQSSLRLFNSGTYGNLGAAALSVSTWDACIQSMYKMAEATSSARMGIRPSFLVVPIELEKTALTIMESAGEPGTGDNDANVRRGSSRVVVCPEMTDATDWLAAADPRVWPGIVVGFRFGSVPEVFVAGDALMGSMFTNDEMRVKARYVFAAGVGDYRALYKANC